MPDSSADPTTPSFSSPIVQSFFHALDVYDSFCAKVSKYDWAQPLLEVETSSPESLCLILRELPTSQRRPVAFGVYGAGARFWDFHTRSTFMGEFLDPVNEMEQLLLNSAAVEMTPPREWPTTTLEEFPSRLWQRALAKNSIAALLSAAAFSRHRMYQLISEFEELPENPKKGADLEVGESIPVHVPSGNPPQVVDLIALSPRPRRQLRNLAVLWLQREILADDYRTLPGALEGFTAWGVGGEFEVALIDETHEMLKTARAKKTLATSAHLNRLGCLMFRMGHRGLARACARAHSDWLKPSFLGWHLYPVRQKIHQRIRAAVIRPDSDTESWMTDPALASSAMSLPLWLADDTSRVPALVDLFNRAEECPWIFPRLYMVFVWHLAAGGYRNELEEIHRIDPECALDFHHYQGEDHPLDPSLLGHRDAVE